MIHIFSFVYIYIYCELAMFVQTFHEIPMMFTLKNLGGHSCPQGRHCMVQSQIYIGVFVISHFLRSFLERSTDERVRQDLAELRVEVHRTRTLVSDYNLILEGCEVDLGRRKLFLDLACGINIGLAVLCLILWCKVNLPLFRDRVEDPGGEVLPELVTIEGEAGTPVRPGPTKPSDLAKRKLN